MFSIPFTPTGNDPLYLQLYQAIRREIEGGQLSAGTRMPSKRKLAGSLGISVVTVESAYGQLVAEGYLESRDRSGFYVLPVVVRPGHAALPPVFVPPLTEQREEAEFDFSTSGTDPAGFPFSTWAKLSREVLSSRDQALLTAAHPQGVEALRQAIVRHLFQFRGIRVSPEQVIVGAGSEFLTTLLVQLLGAQGGYALEDPGYGKIAQIFRANGATVSPIALDEKGLSVAGLRQSGARVVHITPSHHFPLGTVMPVSRRIELLEWCREGAERYIIEDDYDSEFRFSGRPIPALQGMDRDGRVIYLNTFAKSLAPSLRISYMVLPPALLERYRKELLFYSSTVPSFEQYTLAAFMDGGHMERHISRTRNRCQNRYNAFLQAAQETGLDRKCSFSGGESGLHLLMKVQDSRRQETLTELAKAKGIRLYPLNAYYLCEPPALLPPTFVMGYARLTEEQLRQAAERLEQAWSN